MRSARAVMANGANFETALSYAIWDVTLEKMSRGGGGFGLNPNRKAVAIGPRPPKGSTMNGRRTVSVSSRAGINISTFTKVLSVLMDGPLNFSCSAF